MRNEDLSNMVGSSMYSQAEQYRSKVMSTLTGDQRKRPATAEATHILRESSQNKENSLNRMRESSY